MGRPGGNYTDNPFERRDDRLDAGAEVSQGTVGEPVARHLGDREAEMLAEDDVSDSERTNVRQVLSGCEASVEYDVGTRPVTLALLSMAGSALSPDEPAAGQTLWPYSVSRRSFTITTAGGSDRNDFLLRRHLVASKDAACRLVDDALGQRAEM
jgi:hypothetical protein